MPSFCPAFAFASRWKHTDTINDFYHGDALSIQVRRSVRLPDRFPKTCLTKRGSQ